MKKNVYIFLLFMIATLPLKGAQAAKDCIEKQLNALAKNPLPTKFIDDYIAQERPKHANPNIGTQSKTDTLKYQLFLSSKKAADVLGALKQEREYNELLKQYIAKKNKGLPVAPTKKFADDDLDKGIHMEKTTAITAYVKSFERSASPLYFDTYLSAEKAFWALNALKAERQIRLKLETDAASSAPGGPNPDGQ